MPLAYKGTHTLGSAIPIALTLNAALGTAVGEALLAATAELDGALAVQLAMSFEPPNLALTIAGHTAVGVSLAAGSFTLQPTLMVELIASLQLKVAELRALLELGIILTQSGIHLYTYTGPADTLGDELASATDSGFPGGGPADETFAIVLAATEGAARGALRTAFNAT
jgi:hypothetical protein